MKKNFLKVLFAVVLLLFLVVSSLAVDWCNYSPVKTASAKILQGAGTFYGVVVATDGTNAVTMSVYDNIAASGTLIVPTTVIPSSATNRVFAVGFTPAVKFNNGLYVAVSVAGGGSCSYVVYY